VSTLTHSRPATAAGLTEGSPVPVGLLCALVPAHNEEAQIAETIESLQAQTIAPDRIVVIADNCTDRTVEIAESYDRVEVLRTVANSHKKAGGLNQALDMMRATGSIRAEDAVLVMDADSALEPRFLEGAVRRLAHGDVAAVGGTFYGKPGGGLVGMFQRNEYARYARDVGRLHGNVLVLTGTATVFRAGVFDHVRWARSEGVLPGAADTVYDTNVLTEDNELTLALLHLGYQIISPIECRLSTDVMGSWGDLARQRLRWKRGALENLLDYGWTPITRHYWGRQLLSLVGVLVIFTYLATIVWSLVTVGSVTVSPLWLAVTAFFVLERIVTVRARGRRHMLLAATLVVEMAYDVFLQAVQAVAFVQAATKQEKKW
jgi:cellulose synthase/poly-beta-1,6-N-acetylglucosamine synthase-like glycosyltransferase